MSEEAETARRYRLSAERLRAIAGEDANPGNRKLLHGVADEHEQMARDIEAIDQLNRSIPKAIPRVRFSS